MGKAGFGVILAATVGFCLHGADIACRASEEEIQKTYTDLTLSDHWRKAKAASDKLVELGEEALPTVLKGTRHEKRVVREHCYQILQSQFTGHDEAIDAMITGVNDDESGISYACAFHLGEHRLAKVKSALAACVKDSSKDDKTRYAAAKSLAELGDHEVMTMLYTGLGSEDHYTRYLSNIGVKALCGKDLTNFGYRSPWEGAFVSGPAIMRAQGQPIEKAKRKLERWQAIVEFLGWLEKEKPDLFKELDTVW